MRSNVTRPFFRVVDVYDREVTEYTSKLHVQRQFLCASKVMVKVIPIGAFEMAMTEGNPLPLKTQLGMLIGAAIMCNNGSKICTRNALPVKSSSLT